MGMLLLLAGIFHLGFLSDFLSRPIVTGFVSVGTVIIVARCQRCSACRPGKETSSSRPGDGPEPGDALPLTCFSVSERW